VTVTKGEAQARVVSVNAEAEAQRTTLEGNAEAGITFTKGEAEAKALALRAEAYRQFNEAAIIQTVLSMLPEIVRAAAEPLSNIDTLTVLSNDGASDVVKNVTRTVTEANATVKGLTGIDIPALVSNAVGSSESSSGGPTPPGGRGAGRGGGTEGGGGTGAGGSGPATGGGTGGGAGAAGTGTSPSGMGSQQAATTSPEAPLGEAWGSRPATPVTPAAPTRRIETAADADAAMTAASEAIAAADEAIRANAAAAALRSRTDTAAGPARPARGGRPASVDITAETTVEEAALKLASDLRAVPGIERFASVRLADLESGGPRPLRTMWRISREQLDQRYGQLTIGELIDRFGGGLGPQA
jgi:hypothetical protein